jgi:hypothetical protein
MLAVGIALILVMAGLPYKAFVYTSTKKRTHTGADLRGLATAQETYVNDPDNAFAGP